MEDETKKGQFNFAKVAVSILVILALGGGGFYLYQAFLATSETATTANAEKTILKVAGSGSAGFALKLCADDFVKQNSQITFDFLPSADATIAFFGVAERSINIGVASRLPKPEEENDVLEINPFARDAIVLAVNDSVKGVTNLSKEEIVGIWSGKITNWKEVGGLDSRIVVIDREEAESSKKKMRELYLGDTKVSASVVEVHSEGEVLQAVESTKFSVGMLSYARAKSSPKLVPLKLDGLGIGDVESGAYPYVRTFYIVTRKDSSNEVKSFLEFVRSSKMHESFGLFPL